MSVDCSNPDRATVLEVRLDNAIKESFTNAIGRYLLAHFKNVNSNKKLGHGSLRTTRLIIRSIFGTSMYILRDNRFQSNFLESNMLTKSSWGTFYFSWGTAKNGESILAAKSTF